MVNFLFFSCLLDFGCLLWWWARITFNFNTSCGLHSFAFPHRIAVPKYICTAVMNWIWRMPLTHSGAQRQLCSAAIYSHFNDRQTRTLVSIWLCVHDEEIIITFECLFSIPEYYNLSEFCESSWKIIIRIVKMISVSHSDATASICHCIAGNWSARISIQLGRY